MAVLRDLGHRLQRATRRHGVPGAAVAVMRNGRLLAEAATGVTNLDTRVPTTPDTVFQIGSITKVFTATLVMQLVDDGLLDLDAPIIRYLPEFRIADDATRSTVTARHLLSHSSGIDGDFFPDAGRGDDSIARLLDMATLLPSLYPPGEKLSYCNVGFALLGRLVEVLRRETFDSAMSRRLFDPLGMRHAMTLPEDALRFRCAIGHVPDPKRRGRSIVAPRTHLSFGQKAAGSTPAMSATDLLRFVRMHLDHGRTAAGERLLSAASVAGMQRRQMRVQKHLPRGVTGWGLGWFLCDWSGHKVIGHDGGAIGQYAFVRALPAKQLAVALLTNGGDAIGLYQEIFGDLFGALARTREPAIPAPNARVRIDPERYVGRYRNIAASWDIDVRRGALVASSRPNAEGLAHAIEAAPLAFIDRHTAVLRTGNRALDRTTLLFSDDASGAYRFVQAGLRQYRRDLAGAP